MDRPYRDMIKRNPIDTEMQGMNSQDEQKLPKHANAVLTDLLMQMRKPNMRVEQTQGQRRYGPPSDYVGPPPPKGCEVFVGNIPNNIFELELAPIFEKVGRVYDMRLLISFTGRNRGYGFVRYYTTKEADDAVSMLNNFEIRQKTRLEVKKSVDNSRLYISNIPHQKTGDEILKELNRVGVAGITRVIATSGGGCGGVAFVDFKDHRTAAMARRSLLLEEIRVWRKILHGEWALPEPETDVLFVRNLAETTTENQLMDLFNSNSGNGVRRITQMETSAYISFNTPAHAQQAMCALDNSILDGHRIDVLAVHVHGDEEMKPKDICEIPGYQQCIVNQPHGTVPIVPGQLPNATALVEFNPGDQFLPLTVPGDYEGPSLFIPSMMRMCSSASDSEPTCDNQKEDKPYNFDDLKQFEEWCELNED